MWYQVAEQPVEDRVALQHNKVFGSFDFFRVLYTLGWSPSKNQITESHHQIKTPSGFIISRQYTLEFGISFGSSSNYLISAIVSKELGWFQTKALQKT